LTAAADPPLTAPANLKIDYTVFPGYPGADQSTPYGINAAGDISGSAAVDNYSGTVGYLWHKTTNTFTTIDLSPVGITRAYKLSDAGFVVGDFITDLFDPDDPTSQSEFDGFVFDSATSVVATHPDLRLRDITALGDLTGTTQAAFGDPVPAFKYFQGQLEIFSCFGASFTIGEAINLQGDVVGVYVQDSGLQGAFVYRDGVCSDISVPTAWSTVAWDINDRGDVVGQYWGGTWGGNCSYGAFYRYDGKLKVTRIPCASQGYLGSEKLNVLVSINNERVVLGGLDTLNPERAIIYGTLRGDE